MSCFPCCNQSLFWRFRLAPLHSRTLRLSPAKPKLNHHFVVSKCSSSSSDSVSADVVLLSSTECSDGSVIFRFGNASEMIIIEDQTQTTDESAKVVAEVGREDLDKEVESNFKAVDVSDRDAEVVQLVKKKVVRNSQVKSSPKRKPRRSATKVTEVVKEKAASVDSNNRESEGKSVDSSKHISPKDGLDAVENVFKIETNSVPGGNGQSTSKNEGSSNFNVVLNQDLVHHVANVSPPLGASVVENKITTHSDSPELGSEVEVPHGIKVHEENKDNFEGSDLNDDKTEECALNMVSKIDLVPDIEKVSPPLDASATETEITTELASLESTFKSEDPHSVKFEEEENTGAEENSDRIGKIEGTTLNMETKMDLVRDIQRASPPAAAPVIGSEIRTELASLESSSKSEVSHCVKLEEKENTGAEENVERICKIEGITSNTESKINLVPDVELASPPLAAPSIESEIRIELASSESSSKSKAPHNVKLEEEESSGPSGAEETGEGIGKTEGTTSNMASKTNVVPDIEKASPLLAAPAIKGEIRIELASLESRPKSEVPHSVKLEEEESSGAEEKGERIGKIEVTTLNMESNMDLAVEEISSQLGASENSIESEIAIQSTSLGDCSNIEIPHSLEFYESGKDDGGEEFSQKSVPSKEHSINASKMLVMMEDADEGDVGEIMLTSYLPDVASILNEGTVHKTVNQSVDIDIVKSSQTSDEVVPSSFPREEIIEADAQSDSKARVTMLKGVELQSGGRNLEREEIPTAGFFLYSGAALLPNPTKAFAGGEDAYFIACQNWLGVADGVGQWSFEGISAGVYPKELMENCERIVSDRNGIPITDPVEVLNRAAANTQSCGSSTVLVAYFDDLALHVANIGDSGFMIVRNGAVFKRSSPMLYELNFPVRIERGDHPSNFVEVYTIGLDENDVIITATDGLFDNLYEKDIASIVFKSLQENLRPQEIAELLATRAQEVGQLSLVRLRSPLSDEVQAAGYVGYRGGKLDDATVIVSLVKRRFSNHERQRS